MAEPKKLPRSVQAVKDELLDGHPQAEKIQGPEFDAYCTCIARLRDAQARIEREKLIVPDSKNQPVIHPAFAVERQCMDELRKWGDKFKARGVGLRGR